MAGNVNTVTSSGTWSSHPVSVGSAVWECWDHATNVDMTLLQLRGGLLVLNKHDAAAAPLWSDHPRVVDVLITAPVTVEGHDM